MDLEGNENAVDQVGATPSVQRHQLKAHGASSYKDAID